jgi:hypothetical protein
MEIFFPHREPSLLGLQHVVGEDSQAILQLHKRE